LIRITIQYGNLFCVCICLVVYIHNCVCLHVCTFYLCILLYCIVGNFGSIYIWQICLQMVLEELYFAILILCDLRGFFVLQLCEIVTRLPFYVKKTWWLRELCGKHRFCDIIVDFEIGALLQIHKIPPKFPAIIWYSHITVCGFWNCCQNDYLYYWVFKC
jgi:hypothetical protein